MKKLLYAVTILFIAVVLWQVRAVGCVLFGSAQPISEETLAVSPDGTVTSGRLIVDISEDSSADSALASPVSTELSSAIIPVRASEVIPGMPATIARCDEQVGGMNQWALIALAYALPILVIGWLVRLLMRKKNPHA